jgi:hypothetical protein
LKGRALALLSCPMLLAAVEAGDPVYSAFSRLICASALAALYLLIASVLAMSPLLAFKALHYLSDSLKLAHFVDLSLNYKAFLYRSTLHILSGKAYYEGSTLFACVNLALMFI